MGVLGHGKDNNWSNVAAEQKWDYINLSDFRSSSCFAAFSYFILWILLLVSVACYAVDVFTAVQLLLFDNWSSQIKPAVPLNISRWIFAGCIIVSWLLLVYRWIRAIRVMRSGGIAQSYLDPLAVRIQSIRMGSRGRGWRRFLVFAELTKSKKGAEYVALFSYFSFEAWLRILVANGPRQAINAITLYSVMASDVIPTGKHAASAGHSPILQFFVNVGILAQGDKLRAVILFGMLFTLIIWLFSLLSLASSVILYIMFLWHHIPSGDGGLSGYCKRKIETRLKKIVEAKYSKAMAKEDAKRAKQEAKLGDRAPTMGVSRQPTLPVLTSSGDTLPSMPSLSRSGSEATLVPFESRPGTAQSGEPYKLQREPTLPKMDNGFSRPYPARTATQSSQQSYASKASLLGSAAPIAYEERYYSPGPNSAITPGPYGALRQPLDRSLTGSTLVSQNSYAPSGPGSMKRQDTNMSYASSNGNMSVGPRLPVRTNTADMNPNADRTFTPGPPRRQNTAPTPSFDDNGASGRYSPALNPYTAQGQPPSAPSLNSTPGAAFPFPGMPPRQNTGMSDYGRSMTPTSRARAESPALGHASPAPSYRNNSPAPFPTRTATARSASGHPQEFELEPTIPQLLPPSAAVTTGNSYNNTYSNNSHSNMGLNTVTSPTGSAYSAYTPGHMRSGTPTNGGSISHPPPRNFSAPHGSAGTFNGRSATPSSGSFSRPQLLQRSGTAPIPATALPSSVTRSNTASGAYDESIYDAYQANDVADDGYESNEIHGRPGTPARAATSGRSGF